VGPLDAYWHLLIARHAPALVQGVRVLASTPLTPIPPFVASAGAPADQVRALRAAFLAAANREWFAAPAQALLLQGFAEVSAASYQPLLEWDREARAAGFAEPA